MEGALAFKRTPYRPPWRTISGSSSTRESMEGTTMPYPVSSTSFRASATLSYSAFTWASWVSRAIRSPSSPIWNPDCWDSVS